MNFDSNLESTMEIQTEQHEKTETSQERLKGADTVMDGSPDGYMYGRSLYLIITALYVGAYLSQLEMTVVSTSLVAITNDLQDFANSTWIINSYLIVWSGFLILWTQFSQSVGRKFSAILAMILFICFSAGCAGAQTSTQLIILRAFQGLGGSGVNNMAFVMAGEAVEPAKFPKYVALMAATNALASGSGPLIGGGIATHTTWRWVFIFNVPAGIVVLALYIFSIPSGFPFHKQPQTQRPKLNRAALSQLDFIGALLFLCVAIFLVTALQQAVTFYPWRSGLVISFLILSPLALIGFVAWEHYLATHQKKIIPLLSWEFADRRNIGLFASNFLGGTVYISTLVIIPQRLQVVNGFSPFDSGVRLIAYILAVPIGSLLGAIMIGKFRISPCIALLTGSILQLIGVICFAVTPIAPTIMTVAAKTYGFQVILGFGSGLNNGVTNAAVPVIVKKKHLLATSLGANMKFRFLGGAIGLGVMTAVLNGYIRPRLGAFLPDNILVGILQSAETISVLPAGVRERVVSVFADGFNLQWKAMLSFVAAQVLANLMTM